jgi:hypothetical protein
VGERSDAFASNTDIRKAPIENESAQRAAVRSLGGQVLEEPDHQHLEVHFGVDPRLAAFAYLGLIVRRTPSAHTVIKLALGSTVSSFW